MKKILLSREDRSVFFWFMHLFKKNKKKGTKRQVNPSNMWINKRGKKEKRGGKNEERDILSVYQTVWNRYVSICKKYRGNPGRWRRCDAGKHLKSLWKYGEILSYILRMPKQHQEVLILYYYDEFSTKEIAKILDIPQGTVKSRLARGRKQLKDLLEMEGEGAYEGAWVKKKDQERKNTGTDAGINQKKDGWSVRWIVRRNKKK